MAILRGKVDYVGYVLLRSLHVSIVTNPVAYVAGVENDTCADRANNYVIVSLSPECLHMC